jgi:hypothetical protein
MLLSALKVAYRPISVFLCALFFIRRGAGVAELARLESVYTARYRGFESLSLRHNTQSLCEAQVFCFPGTLAFLERLCSPENKITWPQGGHALLNVKLPSLTKELVVIKREIFWI